MCCMDEKINQLLQKFGSFYDLFCETKKEDIRKEYEVLCDKVDQMDDEEDEDKMNRMFVMMECMGMMN